jgi:protein associated with RNAse G/E
MEALGVMAQAGMPSTESAAMPALKKHDYRDIKITENTTVTIDLEELKENMKKSFYKNNFDIFRSAT